MSHADDAVDMVDVEPVNHHIEHHRPALGLDQRRHLVLQREGLGVREKVVHLAGRVLKRQLHMVQPGQLERGSTFSGQAHARGQQVAVVAQPVGFGDDHLQVVAQQRLATRQAKLHRAQLAALAQHTQPVLGAQLFGLGGEIDWVVAKHTMQRAAVGQLRQQPQRRAGARRRDRFGLGVRHGDGVHGLSPRPASAAGRPPA